MTDPARARSLITKIQNSRHRYNPDVLEMCRLLADALGLDDIGAPEPPPLGTWAQDKSKYHRLYMRWYRQYGQLKTRVDA
jgi:hypothetical protein